MSDVTDRRNDAERLVLMTLIDIGAEFEGSPPRPELWTEIVHGLRALDALYTVREMGDRYDIVSRVEKLDRLSAEQREALAAMARRHRATFTMMLVDEPDQMPGQRKAEIMRGDRVLDAVGAAAS